MGPNSDGMFDVNQFIIRICFSPVYSLKIGIKVSPFVIIETLADFSLIDNRIFLWYYLRFNYGARVVLLVVWKSICDAFARAGIQQNLSDNLEDFANAQIVDPR